jgi:hypothetical protein
MTTLLSIVLALVFQASPAPRADAQAVIRQAIDAMGGEPRLRGLHAVKIDAIGHSYLIDQSERPEGPWVTDYNQRNELRDLDAGRLRQTIETRSTYDPVWSATSLVVSDGVAATITGSDIKPGQPAQVDTAAIALALGPERVLFTARDAADLTLDTDEIAQGIRQQVLRFSWKQTRVRLLVNAYTRLLTSIEVVRDDPRGIWGEITERTWFSYWMLESNGLLYPRQWNMEWNGTPIAELTITTFTPNPTFAADAFAIPAPVREAFAKVPRANFRTMKLGERGAPVALADGVLFMPGAWNVTLVKQVDGLVVIEAPISSEYSTQVLDEAARRFPGVRVKAVITTSDAWPHLAGVREYVARGIPVYGLDLNKPILDRLLAASFRAAPDRLATTPAAIQFHAVAEKTTIGEGPNQLAVYPIHGENGERMLMVHLPERRLFYSSDEIIRLPTGDYFMPSYIVEVADAAQRAGIRGIETVFGMHLKPTPWAEIEATVQRLRPAANGPH